MSEMQHLHLLIKVRSYQRCVVIQQDEFVKNELGVAGGHCRNELCERLSCEGVGPVMQDEMEEVEARSQSGGRGKQV